MLPVVLARELSGLKYLSMVSFFAITYTIVVSVVETPMYYSHFKDDEKYQLDIWARPFNMDWMQGLGTICLSYICTPLFFNIKKELVISDQRRTKKVITLSIGFMMVMFVAICVAGNLSLGANMIPSLYTLRKKMDSGDLDLAMKIGEFGFLVVVLTCIPVNVYPIREQIRSFFRMQNNTRNHFILSITILFSAFLIAVVYPDITAIFGIFGGIFANGIGLVIPFLIKIRMNAMDGQKWHSFSQVVHTILLVIVLFIGAGSTYVSIFKP